MDIFYVRGQKFLSMDRKFFSMDRKSCPWKKNFCLWTKNSVRGQTSVHRTDKTLLYTMSERLVKVEALRAPVIDGQHISGGG
jgi:hypothetical protein